MTAALCIDCGTWHHDALMVAAIETGSGPGAILYACPTHARTRAQRIDAPPWLREDIAALDAREARHEDATAPYEPGQ